MTALLNIEQIYYCIQKVVTFLQPLLPIVNCHMVDFITKDHWRTYIPKTIQEDLLQLAVDELYSLPVWGMSKKSSKEFLAPLHHDADIFSLEKTNLIQFVAATHQHTPRYLGVCTETDHILQQHGRPKVAEMMMLDKIMSAKKMHEVTYLSEFISRLAEGQGIETIIDLGSGKGYLGTLLAFYFGLKVLGIDTCSSITQGAEKRAQKLEKSWKGLMRRADERKKGEEPVHRKRKQKDVSTKEAVEKEEDHLLLRNDNKWHENLTNCHHGNITGSEKHTDLLKIRSSMQDIPGKMEKFGETSEIMVTDDDGHNGNDSCFLSDMETLPQKCGSVSDKYYHGNCVCTYLSNRKSLQKNCESVEKERLCENYKSVTKFVTEDTNISSLVQEYFKSKFCDHFAVVGLHTCGNLSPSSLRIFVKSEKAKLLCNIGCCYHLLKEEFLENPSVKETDPQVADFGFPLSDYLRKKKFTLGRNARMIALQCTDRIAGNKLPSESLFYRAALQVILQDKMGDREEIAADYQVGKIAAKSKDFVDYTHRAFKKLKLDIKISDDEIMDYYRRHASEHHQLNAFFLFRACLSPVVEGLILLDRLAFLYEQECVKAAYLAQLFDRVTSPRCYGILAFK